MFVAIEVLAVVARGGKSVVTIAGVKGISGSIGGKVVAVIVFVIVVKKLSESVEKLGSVGEKMAAVVIFVVEEVTTVVELPALGFAELGV